MRQANGGLQRGLVRREDDIRFVQLKWSAKVGTFSEEHRTSLDNRLLHVVRVHMTHSTRGMPHAFLKRASCPMSGHGRYFVGLFQSELRVNRSSTVFTTQK